MSASFAGGFVVVRNLLEKVHLGNSYDLAMESSRYQVMKSGFATDFLDLNFPLARLGTPLSPVPSGLGG